MKKSILSRILIIVEFLILAGLIAFVVWKKDVKLEDVLKKEEAPVVHTEQVAENEIDMTQPIKAEEEEEEPEEEPAPVVEEPVEEAPVLAGFYLEEPITFTPAVQAKIASMTNEEKAAQVFMVTPEQLTGQDPVLLAGATTEAMINQYPVGGVVYSSKNFQTPAQITEMLNTIQRFSESRIGVELFLGVEEIGGTDHSPYAALAAITPAETAEEVGKSGDPQAVNTNAELKAEYLTEAGFNMLLGTSAELAAYGVPGSYGADPMIVSELLDEELLVNSFNDLSTVVGKFPWREGIINNKPLEELYQSEFMTFQSAVNDYVPAIMVSNTKCAAITGDTTTPCSLSYKTINVIRGDMGYEGILITDALSDAVIADHYEAGKAAVEAIDAGMDMIYSPADFPAAYAAVLEAINNGSISKMRIDNAVGRILTEKGYGAGEVQTAQPITDGENAGVSVGTAAETTVVSEPAQTTEATETPAVTVAPSGESTYKRREAKTRS